MYRTQNRSQTWHGSYKNK